MNAPIDRSRLTLAGGIAWKMLNYRRSKNRQLTQRTSADSVKRLDEKRVTSTVEEPQPVYHLPPPRPFEGGQWKPQIRSVRGEAEQPSQAEDTKPEVYRRPLPPQPQLRPLPSVELSPSSALTHSTDISTLEKTPSPTPLKRVLSWKRKKAEAEVDWEMLQTPPPSYIIANGGPNPLTPQTGRILPTPPPAFHLLTPRPNFPFGGTIPAVASSSSSAPIQPVRRDGPSFLDAPPDGGPARDLIMAGRKTTLPQNDEHETHSAHTPLPSPKRLQSFQHQQSNRQQSPNTTRSSQRSNRTVDSSKKRKKKRPQIPHSPSSTSSLNTAGSSSPNIPKLPRLMNVVNTFTPQMDDELKVYIGELLRMMQEFGDGWCLVQRVGKVDAEKGVIPRACLEERTSATPGASPTRESTRKGSGKQVSAVSFGWR